MDSTVEMPLMRVCVARGGGGSGEASLRDLVPPLICHMMVWEGRDAPQGLWQVGELSLPFTSCSTRESGPCTLPGPHSRDGPEGVGVDELTPRE